MFLVRFFLTSSKDRVRRKSNEKQVNERKRKTFRQEIIEKGRSWQSKTETKMKRYLLTRYLACVHNIWHSLTVAYQSNQKEKRMQKKK